MVAVAAGTGLRLSELLGFCWQDVNSAEALLHVRAQLSNATRKKPARLMRLKTGAGERDVYLVAELVDLLKADRAKAFQRGHAKPENFIFCTRDGKPLTTKRWPGAARRRRCRRAQSRWKRAGGLA